MTNFDKWGFIMNNSLKLTVIAIVSAFSVSAQAATMHIGSAAGIEASVLDSGNFDTGAADGALALAFKGNEWVNWGTHSSWMWLNSSLTGPVNTLGSNPLSAVNIFGDGTNITLTGNFGSGGLLFTQTMTLSGPDSILVNVSLTNTTSAPITGVQWGVGLDPDVDRNFSPINYATTNTIIGSGNDAAVMAQSVMFPALSLTLHNATGAGAFDVAAFINSGDCCSPVDPSLAFPPQLVGFTTTADDSISLAYNIGTLGAYGNSAHDFTRSFSYEYIMAVPEPETYAMLLAGLGLVGFSARRRKVA